MPSFVDSEVGFYDRSLIPAGSLQDRRFSYWSALSALTPKPNFSTADHKKNVQAAASGLSASSSIADMDMVFLIAQGAVGDSLSDKWKNYYETH